MKKKVLGLLIIPLAIGAIGLTAVSGVDTHAESAKAAKAQVVDAPEPGDTPDANEVEDNNTTADVETND
jgi:hypothetical protein